ARSRVRIEQLTAVQTEAVKGAGPHRPDQAGEITPTFPRQLKCPAVRAALGPTLDDDLDRLTSWRPNAKMCSPLRQNICPDMKWAKVFIRHLLFIICHWSLVISRRS